MHSTPFDAVAHDYDKTFTHTVAGQMQRERVWAALLDGAQGSASTAGLVLEFNCGTGADAVWLTQQGYQVLATDISPQMVAVARAKIHTAGYADRAEVAVFDLRHLSMASLPLTARPTLVLSNFGGMNCLSPTDLQGFGKKLHSLIAPRGQFIAVVMGRFCWQESLYFLLKMRWRAVFRRLRRTPVAAYLDERTTIPTWYYAPREFCRFFPNMQVKMLRPIGFWLPPSYLDAAFRRWPRLLQWLNRAERMCSRVAALAWASDHFLICFEAKPCGQEDG